MYKSKLLDLLQQKYDHESTVFINGKVVDVDVIIQAGDEIKIVPSGNGIPIGLGLAIMPNTYQWTNKKYEINANDNPGTKLLKTLFNIIYEFEPEIVRAHQDENLGNLLELEFNVRGTGFKDSDLEKIFDVDRHTLGRWLNLLDYTYTGPTTFSYENSRFKDKVSYYESRFRLFLNYQSTQQAHLMAKIAFGEFRIRLYEMYQFREIFHSIIDKYIVGFDRSINDAELSRLLNYERTYLSRFFKRLSKTTRLHENINNYFDLLTSINLLDYSDFKDIGYDIEYLDDMKQEIRNFFFKVMRYKELIIDDNMRPLFNLVVDSLETLSRANTAKNNDIKTIYPYMKLGRTLSSRKFPVANILSVKFKRQGDNLNFEQVFRLLTELRKDYFFTNIRPVIMDIKRYSKEYIDRQMFYDYDIYFPELKTIQVRELFDLTLGMDVQELMLVEEAQLKQDGRPLYKTYGQFIRAMRRHHLLGNKDKSCYLIMQDTGRGTAFKLVVLPMRSHRKVLHIGPRAEVDYQILAARMNHLYELRTMSYRSNYKQILENEFKNKEITINSHTVKLWGDFSFASGTFPKQRTDYKYEKLTDQVRDDWIKNWYEYKTQGEDAFFNNHFPQLNQRYKFLAIDKYRFLAATTKCKYPDFWAFYYEEYVPLDYIYNNYPPRTTITLDYSTGNP